MHNLGAISVNVSTAIDQDSGEYTNLYKIIGQYLASTRLKHQQYVSQ